MAALNVFLFYFHFRRSLDNEWRYSLWLHTPFIVSYHRLPRQEKVSFSPTGRRRGNSCGRCPTHIDHPNYLTMWNEVRLQNEFHD